MVNLVNLLFLSALQYNAGWSWWSIAWTGDNGKEKKRCPM